ncbi:MAG: DUF1957 domain-containing protein [Chloroflexi bacterium]|nr:DUF1957 domain-containing protein [Chloroflexota bacterium]
MTTPPGYCAFVLHSHLPYVRRAGRWPHGEEMLHEALAETYIPLLNALHDLRAEGVSPRLTIGLTPILIEQLQDVDVLRSFELYVLDRLELARAELARLAGDAAMLELARFYERYYAGIMESFVTRYRRDVVGAFRALQDDGVLDILTSAATHAYLPLVERDSTIHAQLKTGVDHYRLRLGRAPRGLWLPECAYRPAYLRENEVSYLKPGIEAFVEDVGLGYFFTETHVIEGGQLVGKVAGDVAGPYGGLPRRRLVLTAPTLVERGTSFRPYYIQHSHVAVLGRNARTGLQVWSASRGYPGDPLYREFHKKEEHSGFQYWCVTGPGVDLGDKQLYDPAVAFQRAQDHAGHFAHLVHDELAQYQPVDGAPGIVISAYDTELFGHWWFEGVEWLAEAIRRLARSEQVVLTTVAEYLASHPPTAALNVPESSWGEGGTHWTWSNPTNEWMWPEVHSVERRMEDLVARAGRAEGLLGAMLEQAGREALLVQASDWPFLVSTGQAHDYARDRFQQHLARFNHLAALVDLGLHGQPLEPQRGDLEAIASADSVFPALDVSAFAPREGRAG